MSEARDRSLRQIDQDMLDVCLYVRETDPKPGIDLLIIAYLDHPGTFPDLASGPWCHGGTYNAGTHAVKAADRALELLGYDLADTVLMTVRHVEARYPRDTPDARRHALARLRMMGIDADG